MRSTRADLDVKRQAIARCSPMLAGRRPAAGSLIDGSDLAGWLRRLWNVEFLPRTCAGGTHVKWPNCTY
jgi:hypothetical protein